MNATETMFANAARRKYRFPAPIGLVMAEDLFDLDVGHIDWTYRNLSVQLKDTQGEEDSLLSKVNATLIDELKEKMEIVRFVFDEKQAKIEAAKNAAAAKERKQQILSIIHDKETQALKDLPMEELKKLLEQE